MYYLIKFMLKLLLVIFLYMLMSLFSFFELFFMFSQKETYKFLDFIDEIYYKNPEENGEEKWGHRKIAKDKTIIDWLIDYKSQYHLSYYKNDTSDAGDFY